MWWGVVEVCPLLSRNVSRPKKFWQDTEIDFVTDAIKQCDWHLHKSPRYMLRVVARENLVALVSQSDTGIQS